MRRSFFALAALLSLTAATAQQVAPPGAYQPLPRMELGNSPTSVEVPSGAHTPGLTKPLETAAALVADYKIGPNDLIEIEVFGVPELKRTVRVNSAGLVTLALVGNVALAGLTGQQAEESIAAKYAQKYLQNPQVSVFIREYTTKRITIDGAVGRPGIYPMTGQLTLLRALALAGGEGSMAELSEVMIFRDSAATGKRESMVFNLEKIREGSVEDPAIVADDVIVVRRNSARATLRDSLFRDILDSINPFSGLSGN